MRMRLESVDVNSETLRTCRLHIKLLVLKEKLVENKRAVAKEAKLNSAQSEGEAAIIIYSYLSYCMLGWKFILEISPL